MSYLSGVNRGANTGRSILHSGTVGAAFTAYQQDCPALAVSSAVLDLAASDPVHWESAAHFAGLLFDWLIKERPRAVLNCNVPDRPLEEVLGIRAGGLAHIGTAQTSVTEEKGTPVRVTLGGEDESAEIESDAALLQRGSCPSPPFARSSRTRPLISTEYWAPATFVRLRPSIDPIGSSG